MAPPEVLLVAIVDAVFDAAVGAWGEVKLADQAAFIAEIGEDARNQALGLADALSVSAQAGDMGVAAGERARAGR